MNPLVAGRRSTIRARCAARTPVKAWRAPWKPERQRPDDPESRCCDIVQHAKDGCGYAVYRCENGHAWIKGNYSPFWERLEAEDKA